MSNDIKIILERMSVLEGKTTPVNVKHGLNAQQKSVHQLPALFKPKSASPVLTSKRDPEHPMHGELVGDSIEPTQTALEEAMTGIEEDMVSRAKRDLAYYLGQLGKKTSDDGQRDGSYKNLDKLEKKQRIDRDLLDKAVDAVKKKQAEEDQGITEDPTEQEIGSDAPAVPIQNPQLPEGVVKTYEMEDGSMVECYGDEQRGFELRRGSRALPTRFRNMSDADVAVKLFKKRQQPQDISQDYVEER